MRFHFIFCCHFCLCDVVFWILRHISMFTWIIQNKTIFPSESCILIEACTWRRWWRWWRWWRHVGQFPIYNVNIYFLNYFNINSTFPTFHKAMKSFLIKIKCKLVATEYYSLNSKWNSKCVYVSRTNRVNKNSYFRNSHKCKCLQTKCA